MKMGGVADESSTKSPNYPFYILKRKYSNSCKVELLIAGRRKNFK
jgi:hypothetical protein